MYNYLKIVVVMAIVLFSISACKAVPPDNEGASDTLKTGFDVQGDSITIEKSYDGEWITDYKQAMQIAAKENKTVLMDFTGSDWCGWCIKLDKEVFSQKEFTDYAKQNLVLLKLDFPKKKEIPEQEKAQNEKLAQQYGIQGFPTIILLDKTGKTIGNTGYQRGGAASYVEHLKTFIK